MIFSALKKIAKKGAFWCSAASESASTEGLDEWQRVMRKHILRREAAAAKAAAKADKKARSAEKRARRAEKPPLKRAPYSSVAFGTSGYYNY